MAMRLRAIGVGVLSLVVVVASAAAAFAGASAQATHVRVAGNGLIAFTRPDGIYVMRSDGSGVRTLKRGVAAHASGLTWSPDGRKLAFVAEDAMWVMNADGSDAVRLIAGDPDGPLTTPASPTWSPDGRKIAFTAGPGYHRDIWVMNADGSNTRPLARTHGYREAEVDWSPSGGQVAFSGAGWVTCIWVINTNGSNLHGPLTGGWGWAAMPDWSPDGRQIVFADLVHSTGNLEISLMDAGGGSRVRLTSNKVVDWQPVWSPDGSRIAFVRATRVHPPLGGDARQWNDPTRRPEVSSEIYVMNADGTGATRLTHNQIGEASPAWQPIPQAP